MAQRVVTIRTDDLTGEDLGDGGETVEFALDGITYELDLSADSADKFREVFMDYVAAGRKVAGGRSSGKSKRKGPAAAEVRAWAVESGLDVPARGRVPQEIYDMYKAAH